MSLSWALDREAKVFYSWIDQGKAEAARQVELGLAANDGHVGTARAATRSSTGQPTTSTLPAVSVMRVEPPPEQERASAGRVHAAIATLRSKRPVSESA